MSNLLKIEMYKLKRSKVFYFFIFLSLLQAIVIYVFSESLKVQGGKETLPYMLFMQNTLASNLIAGAFAVDFIVTEFSSGYIKNLIAYGHRRKRIFLSKALVYYFGILILTFITPLTMAGVNTVRNGYGEVFTFHSFISLIGLLLLITIIQVAVGSVSIFIAFISRSTSITLGFVLGIDFLYRIMSFMAVRNSSMTWVFNKFILFQTNIVLSDQVGTYKILQAVSISFLTILACMVIGNYIFEKTDIK